MNQKHSYKMVSLLGTSLVCAALLGGCATTDALNKAQTTADQASQKADEANANANSAKTAAAQASQKADQANVTADGARSTADQASATANAAKAEADKAMQEVSNLAEKIDRMFKKTMQK